MSYVKPDDVLAPRHRWTLIEVLYPGGEETWAVAIGIFDDAKSLAVRWNGNDDNPVGAPQARGNPTWLMVDTAFEEAILSVVPEEKRSLARAILGR